MTLFRRHLLSGGMSRRRIFLLGVVAGLALTFGARYVVNKTALADWLISPLLVPIPPTAPMRLS